MNRIPGGAVLAVVMTSALVAAAPVAAASATTSGLPAPAVQALATTGTLPGIDLSQLPLLGYGLASAYGGTDIGNVLNGGTTVCVTTGSSACSTNAAP
jgi:hypothetical protein